MMICSYRFSLVVLLLTAVVATSLVQSYELLRGINVQKVVVHRDPNQLFFADDERMRIDLGEFLSSARRRSLLCFGAYAGDLNTIEYAQQLRYYIPKLKAQCDIDKVGFIINGSPAAARLLCQAVDLLTLATTAEVDVFVDPTGHAGRAFGVHRGWFADQTMLHPYFKLFCMMPWASLPSIFAGYVGHPTRAKPWIEDALAVGQYKGRWPDFGLELGCNENTISHSDDTADDETTSHNIIIRKNKFDTFPWVGTHWALRPFELATLRLQNLLGVTLQHWKDVMPNEEELGHGILTQQPGCLVYDTSTQSPCYEWRDEGSCHVADFEDIVSRLCVVKSLSPSSSSALSS